MGKIIAQIKSQSNPGKSYDIVEGSDGVIYCTCQAWKMRKTCKHLVFEKTYKMARVGFTTTNGVVVRNDRPTLIKTIITNGITNGDWS